jgi:hypothetical protein
LRNKVCCEQRRLRFVPTGTAKSHIVAEERIQLSIAVEVEHVGALAEELLREVLLGVGGAIPR